MSKHGINDARAVTLTGITDHTRVTGDILPSRSPCVRCISHFKSNIGLRGIVSSIHARLQMKSKYFSFMKLIAQVEFIPKLYSRKWIISKSSIYLYTWLLHWCACPSLMMSQCDSLVTWDVGGCCHVTNPWHRIPRHVSRVPGPDVPVSMLCHRDIATGLQHRVSRWCPGATGKLIASNLKSFLPSIPAS